MPFACPWPPDRGLTPPPARASPVLSGERPPIHQHDWQAAFDKYRASPEFKKVHSKMTLEEFKFIFWMEYGHR